MSKHPMQGLLSKAQEKQVSAILADNRERLRAALESTVEGGGYADPLGAAHFMTGVAAGIMVTLHWLKTKN